MARKSIFDIINEHSDSLIELQRIDDLLHYEEGIYVNDELLDILNKGTPISIIKYIDNNLFCSWKYRGTCISTDDLFSVLGIDNLSEVEQDNYKLLLYCECVANLIHLTKNKAEANDSLGNSVDAAYDNVKLLLARYGYEVVEIDDEKVLVVEHNAAATSVAEILDYSSGKKVLEYNHFLLKGDIAKKKAILYALGNEIEPKREQLENINKELTSNIFFMLNNLDIRHNNRSKKDLSKYKEYVAKMQKSKLEEWYDELYQMMLLALLQLDNVERMNKVKDLKAKVVGGNKK